jgi:hypothetical protein
LWFGLRLLAIDGSTTKLPMTDDVVRHFGVWNVRQGAPSPMARVSQLFDVLNTNDNAPIKNDTPDAASIGVSFFSLFIANSCR